MKANLIIDKDTIASMVMKYMADKFPGITGLGLVPADVVFEYASLNNQNQTVWKIPIDVRVNINK